MRSSNVVPRAAGGLPLLGHIRPLLRDPREFLSGLPAQGNVVRIGIGPARVVVVCDLELTRQVLRDDRTFDKGGPLYDRMREVLGGGLVNAPYEGHRRLRRLVQPAFHPARLAGYAEVMTRRVAQAADRWRDGQVLDVRAEMMAITSGVLSTTMFSDSLSPSQAAELLDDITVIADGIYRRMLTPPPLDRLPIPGNLAYRRATARLNAALGAITRERRAAGLATTGLVTPGPATPERADLLTALLTAQDDGGGSLTDAEINDTVLSFFLAGTETTATGLAWALYLMSQHPEIEERVHAEVDSVLAGRPATHADLPGLRLTADVMTESFRLYPPVWFVTRTATTDTELGGYRLPRGTSVVCSPYLIHRSEDVHAAPATFDPDRWAALERGASPRDGFVPFGDGARKCVGDTFASTEATLVLATVAARWRLSAVEGEPVRPAVGAVLRPHTLSMRVSVRR